MLRPIKKYMKDYDENKDFLYLVYLDKNKLYGSKMFQKLPMGGFT